MQESNKEDLFCHFKKPIVNRLSIVVVSLVPPCAYDMNKLNRFRTEEIRGKIVLVHPSAAPARQVKSKL